MDPSDIRKAEIPMQVRLQPVGTVDIEKRTAELVWTAGGRVLRYDWWTGERYWEELSLEPKAVRMDRLQSGAPLLNTHNRYDLGDVIGVVEDATLETKQGTATVRFSKRDDVEPYFQDVKDGIIRNVSVGYVVHRYLKIDPPAGTNDYPTWRAIDWEPSELSLVPIGADAGAQVRSAIPETDLQKVRTFPCEFVTPAAAAGSITRKEPSMDVKSKQGGDPAADKNAGTEVTQEQREAIAAAERVRVQEIGTRVRAAGLPEEFAKPLIDGNKSIDEACRAIVDEVAKAKKTAAPINPTRVEITFDERVKLRTVVSAALSHRIQGKGELLNGAGEYRYMSMLRLAEEVLARQGERVRGLAPMEIAARAFTATSDFPNILADVANKRLRQAYEENVPSYTRWARRAVNAPDFKNINVTQLSGAPDLKQVLEGGEFKRGAMSDGKEVYQIFTYGRIISYTRQALINDDLNALDRTPRALAAAGRRLENRTVYGILTTNGNMADGGALFNATAYTTAGSGHANLGTGAGSALGTGALITGRAAMRTQKGKQNEELNLAPSYLIVPAALEQTAYQMTSSQFVPTTATGVNEFRAGGRTALEPIVEAVLDATSATNWYLAADNGQVDTVEYCYLDGYEGMSIDSQIGFTIDGMDVKARLDFAAAPIDFRGIYKAVGT